jgi:F-type H+-transporting ATPase subunit b
MPQLDFSNPLMLSKLVWMLIIFGLLFYVLKTYALPQVAAVLDERAARIAADLNAARDAQAAGEAAMA